MTDRTERLGRTDRLDATLTRRDELHKSIIRMERALAAPAGGVGWRDEVKSAFDALRDMWGVHLDVTEGPDGLHAEVVDAAPRLSGPLERLRDEHGKIAGTIDAAAAKLDAEADDVRVQITELLGRLVRHRQRGADLLHEAYEVDLGGRG